MGDVEFSTEDADLAKIAFAAWCNIPMDNPHVATAWAKNAPCTVQSWLRVAKAVRVQCTMATLEEAGMFEDEG